MTDLLILACCLGLIGVAGWLLALIDPEAPPPGLTGLRQPPGAVLPRAGNPREREAALLVGSGAFRRAP